MRASVNDRLLEICKSALDTGRGMDLSGCNYGQTDGCSKIIARPTNYYYFLAGLVRSQELRYILEIGTHCGGSIMSMERGLRQTGTDGCKLVTIDVVAKNRAVLDRYPHIKRLTGDSTDDETARRAIAEFDRPIDLLYIDSLHEYGHTRSNIDIYSKGLRPAYMALDDIHLSAGMERVWAQVRGKFKDSAVDISELVGRRKAGFGLVKLR